MRSDEIVSKIETDVLKLLETTINIYINKRFYVNR